MQEVNNMKNYIIALASITYAMKAQTLLRTSGIKCDVIRTPKNLASGCGYSIKAWGDIKNISAILESGGIVPRGVTEGS